MSAEPLSGSMRSSIDVSREPIDCGTCSSFPFAWQVAAQQDWFQFTDNGDFNDCTASWQGMFTLWNVPLGQTSAYIINLFNGTFDGFLCATWQSNERAPYIETVEQDGALANPCRNNRQNIPRFEVVATKSPEFNPQNNGDTTFWFFLPYFAKANWGPADRLAWFVWTAKAKNPSQYPELTYQHCVKCFYMQFLEQLYLQPFDPLRLTGHPATHPFVEICPA